MVKIVKKSLKEHNCVNGILEGKEIMNLEFFGSRSDYLNTTPRHGVILRSDGSQVD